MLYLLDANVMIDAHRDYYPLDRVPEFWTWLLRMANAGRLKIPKECYEEVTAGAPDELVAWMKDHRRPLLLEESVEQSLVDCVVSKGYAPDLTDGELEGLGRDPFLVAYALCDVEHRIVVTQEVSKPKKQRANRRIPDVSDGLGVECCTTFRLIRNLDFRTDGRGTVES